MPFMTSEKRDGISCGLLLVARVPACLPGKCQSWLKRKAEQLSQAQSCAFGMLPLSVQPACAALPARGGCAGWLRRPQKENL